MSTGLLRPAAFLFSCALGAGMISTVAWAADPTLDEQIRAGWSYDDSHATPALSPWVRENYRPFTYLNHPTDPTKMLPYTDPSYPLIHCYNGWTAYTYYYHENRQHGLGYRVLPRVNENDRSQGCRLIPFEGDTEGQERIPRDADGSPMKGVYPDEDGYAALRAPGARVFIPEQLDTLGYLFPDKQIARVRYVDDDTAAVLGEVTLIGKSEYTSTYHPDAQLALLRKAGYEVVSNNFPENLVYDTSNNFPGAREDVQEQLFEIHLKKVVTPGVQTSPTASPTGSPIPAPTGSPTGSPTPMDQPTRPSGDVPGREVPRKNVPAPQAPRSLARTGALPGVVGTGALLTGALGAWVVGASRRRS